MTLDGIIHDLTIDIQLKMEGVGHDLSGVWELRDGAAALKVQVKQCSIPETWVIPQLEPRGLQGPPDSPTRR